VPGELAEGAVLVTPLFVAFARHSPLRRGPETPERIRGLVLVLGFEPRLCRF
jgi:hypothetical protein